jgi:hypothetical protein
MLCIIKRYGVLLVNQPYYCFNVFSCHKIHTLGWDILSDVFEFLLSASAQKRLHPTDWVNIPVIQKIYNDSAHLSLPHSLELILMFALYQVKDYKRYGHERFMASATSLNALGSQREL